MRLTPIGSINGSQPPGEGQSSTGDILGVPSPTGEGQWEGTAQECELLSFPARHPMSRSSSERLPRSSFPYRSPLPGWKSRAVGIETKGAAGTRNCFTNFIHPGGGRSCMEKEQNNCFLFDLMSSHELTAPLARACDHPQASCRNFLARYSYVVRMRRCDTAGSARLVVRR